MKVSHIEHLGIAVKSLEEAIPYWENVLGLKCYNIEEVADQKVKTAFFIVVGAHLGGEHHRKVYREARSGCSPRCICS